ncbi:MULTISPECIES: hypothetical protein [Streptomyces]|uniref:PE-PGRS family protein n=2 Tax=Streptomyces TaxID=1883 RepID=A0ABV9J9W7_9ACTN
MAADEPGLNGTPAEERFGPTAGCDGVPAEDGPASMTWRNGTPAEERFGPTAGRDGAPAADGLGACGGRDAVACGRPAALWTGRGAAPADGFAVGNRRGRTAAGGGAGRDGAAIGAPGSARRGVGGVGDVALKGAAWSGTSGDAVARNVPGIAACVGRGGAC